LTCWEEETVAKTTKKELIPDAPARAPGKRILTDVPSKGDDPREDQRKFIEPPSRGKVLPHVPPGKGRVLND